MYPLPAVQEALRRLWHYASQRLTLQRETVWQWRGLDDDVTQHWESPTLLMSQCCGYPLRTHYAHQLRPIARFAYDLPGTTSGDEHCSVIITQRQSPIRYVSDIHNHRLVMNDWHSNTGMNLLRRELADMHDDRHFFSQILVSGSHMESIRMVAHGEADIAAIDSISYAYLTTFQPNWVANTRIIHHSRPSPCLPIVVPYDLDPAIADQLFHALSDAINSPETAELRDLLHLCAILPTTVEDYDIIMRYEQEAIALGYPQLR